MYMCNSKMYGNTMFQSAWCNTLWWCVVCAIFISCLKNGTTARHLDSSSHVHLQVDTREIHCGNGLILHTSTKLMWIMLRSKDTDWPGQHSANCRLLPMLDISIKEDRVAKELNPAHSLHDFHQPRWYALILLSFQLFLIMLIEVNVIVWVK